MTKYIAAAALAIIYDLVVLNSGSIPARNIRITANETAVTAALGMGATAENRERWLSGFKRTILLLQNGGRTSCSFGDTRASDTGFWKYEAIIPITITYEGWFDGWFERFFGKTHTETQEIQILDSESFTGNSWG
jgi:hypothetical protein